VTAIAAAIAVAGVDAGDALRYERAALQSGQLWRLITGNFVHLGWPHLAMNAAGLFVAAWLFPALRAPRLWWTTVSMAALAVGVGLFLAKPEVSWYVGLSGVVHAVIAAGALNAWRTGQPFGAIAGALLTAKLAWEHTAGPSSQLAALIGGAIVPEAHLFGAAVGAAVAAAVRVPRAS
jgi:rhomboid family GlyGly-CTERM serine protease